LKPEETGLQTADPGKNGLVGRLLKPATWLSESVEKSRQRVYTAEVLDAVEAARRAGTKVGVIDLSAPYLKDAGAVAQERIAVAGLRLAKLLS
jgi:hypothetical protein